MTLRSTGVERLALPVNLQTTAVHPDRSSKNRVSGERDSCAGVLLACHLPRRVHAVAFSRPGKRVDSSVI